MSELPNHHEVNPTQSEPAWTGEAATRPDGEVVTLSYVDNDKHHNMKVQVGQELTVYYTGTELAKIGDGNVDAGIAKVAEAYFAAGKISIHDLPFHDDLYGRDTE